MLEILVHLEVDQEDFPETLQLLRVEIPDDVRIAPRRNSRLTGLTTFVTPKGWEMRSSRPQLNS